MGVCASKDDRHLGAPQQSTIRISQLKHHSISSNEKGSDLSNGNTLTSDRQQQQQQQLQQQHHQQLLRERHHHLARLEELELQQLELELQQQEQEEQEAQHLLNLQRHLRLHRQQHVHLHDHLHDLQDHLKGGRQDEEQDEELDEEHDEGQPFHQDTSKESQLSQHSSSSLLDKLQSRSQSGSQPGSQPGSRKQSLVPSESSVGSSASGTNDNYVVKPGIIRDEDGQEYTKVLLLGSGESGKSTILQQLRLLHSIGFSEEDLYDFKPFIFGNIVQSAKDLVQAYKRFDFELKDDEHINESDFGTILAARAPIDPSEYFDRRLAKTIAALWANEATPELLRTHRPGFYLMDSAAYFFGELDRISQPDYLPTVNDIIRTRKKTSGIFDMKFNLQGLNIHIFDVGGQRSERKKWIYCFDNVASIIFCVALSEYDQTLIEDKNQNRLQESLALFDSVVNSRWFSRSSIILFLNKIDIFLEKLPYSPLENFYHDYTGGNDANKAAKYILWRFTKVNRSGLPIYPYITQATDTNNMKLVFVVVREGIFSNILQDTGLLA